MRILKDQNSTPSNGKLVIREITVEDADCLLSVGFPFGYSELSPPLNYRFLQAARLVPPAARLVAYHTGEKRAIGTLCLTEDNASLYNIKSVFVDPRFRKLGVASQLFNFALILAKERGARKVFLDVDPTNAALNLYTQLGFQIVGSKLVGQGFLAKFPRLRVITSTLRGQGYFAKFSFRKKGQIIAMQAGSRSSKELLFDVYQRCMDQKLIDFFELDANNFTNGYAQMRQLFSLRDILINDSANSLALIFNRPFFSDAKVELSSTLEVTIPSILGELFKILVSRGMSYAHITLLNVSDVRFLHWFEERGFKSSQFFIMGKKI